MDEKSEKYLSGYIKVTEKIKKSIDKKIQNIQSLQELKEVKNEFLSKNGSITNLMKNLKDLSIEDKKTFGSEINNLKAAISN